MMSTSAIVNLNEEIAAKAAGKNLNPWVPSKTFVDMGKFPRHIPNIGYHKPESWEKVEEWFVDKTGWDESGPALSTERFHSEWLEYAKEHPDHGYAITEEGQFQIYISAFKKEKS